MPELVKDGTGSLSKGLEPKRFFDRDDVDIRNSGRIIEGLVEASWYHGSIMSNKTLASGRCDYLPEQLWVSFGSNADLGYDLDLHPDSSLIAGPVEPPVVRVGAATDPTAPLARLSRDLRTWLDLPVDDIARLCGVRRRQFYNLLESRGATSGSREKHVGLVHGVLEDLRSKLGDDNKKLRAAVLMPVTDDYRSFFDVCAEQDPAEIKVVGKELADRIDTGRVAGMLPRAAPMFRGRGKGSSAIKAIRDDS